MTRHERRRKAKAIALAMNVTRTVAANMATPQAKRPSSRIAQDYARQQGWHDPLQYQGGLHRNNAMPARPQLVSAQRKNLPTHKNERTGRWYWNLDSYVDNRELRLKK